MPVLDNALLACAVAFTPLMVALTVGEPLMKALVAARAADPRAARAVGGQRPARHGPPGAGAERRRAPGDRSPAAPRRTAPSGARSRRPTLVIGHHRDPVHPFSDAGLLAEELPERALLEASSIVELRVAPDRLTDEIAGFIDECWRRARRRRVRRRTARR